jgi:hypothetical protein
MVGCASTSTPPSYSFFEPANHRAGPWFLQIEDWQRRMQAEGDSPLLVESAAPVKDFRDRTEEDDDEKLVERIGDFAVDERRELAEKIAFLALWEGRTHYRLDEDLTLEGDHWPTYTELAERNGDDCDGLDLIAYRLLMEFGFPRDQLFRAVMRRDVDRRNHMVTLWFEDPEDPWVFDATGAMSRRLVRFSKIEGWTPTAVFNERDQFSVAESGSLGQVRASR